MFRLPTSRAAAAAAAARPLSHFRANSTAAAPRWLGTQKQRLGRLLMHGAAPAEARAAGAILTTLARDWRHLLVGAEGFLVGAERRGLYRHAVAWGDMVRVSAPALCAR